MYRIVEKERLNPSVTRMSVEAPMVARKAQAGQLSSCASMRTASAFR